jgi:hypothetical protein
MTMLGHLDRIDAFEFAQYLCLVGRGTRPTLGWTSCFAPIHVMPNIYQFLQEPPVGTTIRTVIPLQVIGVFTSTGVREVIVRHSVNGKPVDKFVPVRPITASDEQSMAALLSPTALAYLHSKGASRIMPSVGSTFSMRLGGVYIPFACGTWNDPPRARRYEAYLDIDALLPSAAEIETVVQECFDRPAIADALAYWLTPVGWGDGLQRFRSEIESCLQARLAGKLVNVRIAVRSCCVDGEPQPMATHARDPALTSIP